MDNHPPRQATPDDLPQVKAITEAAYAQYEALLGFLPTPVVEDYAPRIARGEVWLLEDQAGPFALLVLEPAPTHLFIFSVAVLPARQHEGHGRRLLAFAEARARAAGLSEVHLLTNALMSRNLALYVRLGYREIGRRPLPAHPQSVVVDMAKRITGD
jgi:ribosomal protein S18 acetylase RimI-like enzyme